MISYQCWHGVKRLLGHLTEMKIRRTMCTARHLYIQKYKIAAILNTVSSIYAGFLAFVTFKAHVKVF